MGTETGNAAADLERDVLDNCQDYDFFQAVRLLTLLGHREENDDSAAEDARAPKLRMRPELSLDYPPFDIASIEARHTDDARQYDITTTFMGLYGTASPLPSFYTEELLDQAQDDEHAPRGFLDIIHFHVFPLLYEAWAKYRFGMKAIEQDDTQYWDYLFSLIGLHDEGLRARVPEPFRVLRYLGILSQQQRSLLGLRTILADYLGGLPVEIEPCAPRTVPLPREQRARLGDDAGEAASMLGENCALGECIEDRGGHIVLRIGPMPAEEYGRFFLTPSRMRFIRFILAYYLVQPLDCDLVLIVAPQSIESTTLGGNDWSKMLGVTEWASLGQDTWLVGGTNPEPVEIHLRLDVRQNDRRAA